MGLFDAAREVSFVNQSEQERRLFPALNAWTFPAELPIHDLLEAAASAKARGLELTPSADGQLAFDTPEASLREIASHAADLNMSLTGLVTADCWRLNFTSADAVDRQRAEELLLRLLDQAAALGAGSVLVIPAVVGRHDESAPRVTYASCPSAEGGSGGGGLDSSGSFSMLSVCGRDAVDSASGS